MYCEEKNYLWKKLTENQRQAITNRITNFTAEFCTGDVLDKCGGGTIGDYYRIQLEFFVLDILQSLEKF